MSRIEAGTTETPTPAATSVTLVSIWSTSATTFGEKPIFRQASMRSPYIPGAPGRRTRMNDSPARSRSRTLAMPPLRARAANGCRAGSATSSGSDATMSKAMPLCSETGRRMKPMSSRREATASVTAAALFSWMASSTPGFASR